VRRLVPLLAGLALVAPAPAFAREYHPEEEFKLHPWVSIHLGPIDLSINKAVAYLLLASLVTMAVGIVTMRVKLHNKPDRRQTIGETIYDIAQVQVAEQGLPTKAIGLWFPYVATLMLFIFFVNLLGFIPLPFSDTHWHLFGIRLPTISIYAATAQLSVPIALALMTWTFTHVEGIRWNGPWRYFRSWIPAAPWPALILIVPIEILSQFMRLISLSVRLFANMLAGHMLILVMIGLLFVVGWIGIIGVPVATLFYLFEVVIVISIQAFIFAALSAIYIGSAIEPDH
jgi:F-type H+-transporting ATPase subunit a